jgi:hypothetical protein
LQGRCERNASCLLTYLLARELAQVRVLGVLGTLLMGIMLVMLGGVILTGRCGYFSSSWSRRSCSWTFEYSALRLLGVANTAVTVSAWSAGNAGSAGRALRLLGVLGVLGSLGSRRPLPPPASPSVRVTGVVGYV